MIFAEMADPLKKKNRVLLFQEMEKFVEEIGNNRGKSSYNAENRKKGIRLQC